MDAALTEARNEAAPPPSILAIYFAGKITTNPSTRNSPGAIQRFGSDALRGRW